MSLIKMKNDSKEARKAGIETAISNGAQTIGGFSLPIGIHSLTVADKDAFALLEVTRKSDGQLFALPIVAGTITLEKGAKIDVVISDKPGVKTLVVPDSFYVEMQCNATYAITVEERNGRKVVTAVEPVEETVAAQ